MSATTTNRTANSPFDPKRIIELDPYLEPYIPSLEQRFRTFKGWKDTIQEHEGGYDAFTKGYEKYGFNVAKDGTVTYREWAPYASEAVLIGDFSQCGDCRAGEVLCSFFPIQMTGTGSLIL